VTRRARARRLRKRYVAAGALALCVVGAVYLTRDPTPYFLERRSHVVSVSESPSELVDDHWVHTARLTAASGLTVDVALKRPASLVAGEAAARPAVVLLGGHRTGRDAIKLIPHTRGTVVVALAYPYAGEHRLKGVVPILRHVPMIRTAILDTPPALMLAMDYLGGRPYVDATRVEVVGVSLGVPFVCIAGALDPRFARIWAIHGSGQLFAPLEYSMRRTIPFAPLRVAAAGLATVLIGGPRLAPERWVDRIAPRPFVMINATEDERLPRRSVELLYERARQPKDIIWVPGKHVRPREEVVRDLVNMVLDRMVGVGAAADRVAGDSIAAPRKIPPAA
jgi:hypothetical protein